MLLAEDLTAGAKYQDLWRAHLSGRDLAVEQRMAFGANFVPLEKTVRAVFHNEKLRVRPESTDIANLSGEGKIWGADSRYRQFQMGNRLWHTDSSFKAPSPYASVLYADRVAPLGGHTQYADMRAAYATLPQAMKHRLEGLLAEHSLMFSHALGFQQHHRR